MKRFDAWVLPASMELGGVRARGATSSVANPDVKVRYPTLGAADVTYVCDVLRSAREALVRRNTADVVAALGRVGARFLDSADPIRSEALGLLPATSGLSAPMAEAVLDGMARDWTEDRLVRMLEADLGALAALDGFVSAADTRLLAVGPSLCVQIVAGSVAGVGVTALLRSLAVKAPTLLKPGLGDVVLPVLFARALAEEDADLGAATAVVYWPGGAHELERAALGHADVATVYGSDETVSTLRALAPATTHVVAYHHRVSVGAVGLDALTPERIDATAASAARAVAFFDQRGCVSPQVVYVEEADDGGLERFAEALARAFAALEAELPSGPLDADTAARLHQLRATAEMVTHAHGGSVRHGGTEAPWTVVAEGDEPADFGGVGRFVRLRPLADPRDLAAQLAPLASHLQTLAVAGFDGRLDALARACGRVGVSRAVAFDEVAFPPAWWRHDGRGPVSELVRWVELGATL